MNIAHNSPEAGAQKVMLKRDNYRTPVAETMILQALLKQPLFGSCLREGASDGLNQFCRMLGRNCTPCISPLNLTPYLEDTVFTLAQKVMLKLPKRENGLRPKLLSNIKNFECKKPFPKGTPSLGDPFKGPCFAPLRICCFRSGCVLF